MEHFEALVNERVGYPKETIGSPLVVGSLEVVVEEEEEGVDVMSLVQQAILVAVVGYSLG